MKRNIARLFVLCTQIILLGAFACLISSTLGTKWVENSEDSYLSPIVHFGLTTLCQSDRCDERKFVLDFKGLEWPRKPWASYDLDVILITFIIAMVFVGFALFISLFLCCTTNGRKRWRVTCSLVTLMCVIAVVSTLVGIAYFEGKLSDDALSSSYKHGWSSIIAWLGFALLVIDSALLLVVTCVKPDDHSKKPHSVKSTASYVSSENETYASSRVNKGFDKGDGAAGAYYVGRKPPKSSLKTSIPMNTYEKSKRYQPTNHSKPPDYGSPRGSSNYVYESDYRSSDHDYEDRRRNQKIVYDPRTRASGKSRRKRSFEQAYDSEEPLPREEKRHTYSSGYPRSSQHSSRRETRSTDYNNSRHMDETDYDYVQPPMNTSGYDPRRTTASPYYQNARTPSRHNRSCRTPRSNRYPNIDSDGYEAR